MDLGAAMEEIADRLDTITGLRVYGHPPDAVTAPAAIVTYPGLLQFDQTYDRGMDRMDPSVVALVGKVTTRTARDRISEYCSGSGPKSFKAVIESGTYVEFDTVRVVSAVFDIISMGGIEYLAATFALDITGTGE